METLKNFSKKIQDIGESLTLPGDDAQMDSMSDYVPSPYEGCSSPDNATIQQQQPSCSEVSKQRKSHLERSGQDVTLLDGIDASYFIEDDFDAVDYELQKHINVDDPLEDIERERLRLKTYLQIISKQISQHIVEQSPSYNSQLESVDEITGCLKDVIANVKCIRSGLGAVRKQSGAALGMVAYEKKKRMLRRLRSTLIQIKKLHDMEFELRQALDDGKYALAIRTCIQAGQAADKYRQFNCVKDLITKLAGGWNLIEQKLDKELETLCLVYDNDSYVDVHASYMILDKHKTLSKKIVSYFLSAIEKSSLTVVSEHVGAIGNQKANRIEDLKQDINDKLTGSNVVDTVREVCYVLCKVLCAYHAVLRFHADDDESRAMNDQTAEPSEMYQHLTGALSTVFKTTSNQLVALISCLDLSSTKFDHILDVVDMINRLRRIGVVHFGNHSCELAGSMERQAAQFFSRQHRERLEELTLFLESETFTLCPVPYQFTIFDLQDFQFLKECRDEKYTNGVSPDGCDAETTSFSYSLMTADFVNPFGSHETKSRHMSTISSKSYDEGSAISSGTPAADDLPEDPDDHIPPNLCNTSLNVLRYFGRYIRMASLLPSIAELCVPAVVQLFEYYLYSTYYLFGMDGPEGMVRPERLMEVLNDIERRLFENSAELQHLNKPSLCAVVQLSFVDSLLGAAERMVALESCEFVSRQLDLVRPVIDGLISDDCPQVVQMLDGFYSKVVPATSLLRQLVLDCVASRALKVAVLIQSISSTKWDLDELKSQHSSYVDFLLQDMEAVSLRLETVAETVHLSDETRTLFWDRVVYYAFHAIIQGYCDGGRCSAEGRALMQLDFQHLLVKLETLTRLKPLPHIAYVDGYIKAYYLPERGLEQWISSHSEYSSKQIISLLNVASHVSKKAKNRIIQALNE